MKKNAKILITVGSFVLFAGIGTLAFIKIKRNLKAAKIQELSDSDKRLIAHINKWLKYQVDNNWSTAKEDNSRRVQSAAFQLFTVKGSNNLDKVKAQDFGIDSTSWDSVYNHAKALINFYTF